MTETAAGGAAPERRETYTHGFQGYAVQRMGERTVADNAFFLLPHLSPGMRLLDVGCGPGSITLGLAEALAPGEVVGVDIEPRIVERARAAAAERAGLNVRFEVGDAYALPFPDAAFDAAFARSVLQHLSDPVAALREVRRVLRPGGVVGLRDGDWGSRVIGPPSPLVEEALALYMRLWAINGGDSLRGREHRALLLAAGFARTEAGAVASTQGTAEETRGIAALAVSQLSAPDVRGRLLELGLATEGRLAELEAGLRAWGERPDAFMGYLMCHALGWVEG
jgi:SAM-dependent methyltransferase